MTKWNQLADDAIIEKTVIALKENHIDAHVVETGSEAKKMALAMIPKNAEVMTMSSVTLETIGLTKEVNESGNYDAVKPKLFAMDRKTQAREMQKLGSAPDWAVGSVHAVSEDGRILVASNTGSQLPAYAYSSGHVIWIVGTQKIVKNIDEGMKRLYEHIVPLEDVHMQKLYKVGTAVNKLLIINGDKVPGSLTIIFVKEKLGF